MLSGLRFAEQNIALAGDAVQSAEEDLRVQTERYRAGISTELDQLTSELAFTQAQIGNGFGPADWFPGDHPAMPDVVAHGKQPAVRACGSI